MLEHVIPRKVLTSTGELCQPPAWVERLHGDRWAVKVAARLFTRAHPLSVLLGQRGRPVRDGEVYLRDAAQVGLREQRGQCGEFRTELRSVTEHDLDRTRGHLLRQ